MEAQTPRSTPEDSWFDSPRFNRFISSAMRQDLLCGQHCLAYVAYPRAMWPRREAAHSPYLTTRFKTGAAAPPTRTS